MASYGLEGNTTLTDVEKALVIYDRMCHDIFFPNYVGDVKVGVQHVLENGRGDWYSFCRARAYLMARAGIPNLFDYTQTAMWNKVYIDGQFYAITGSGKKYADTRVDHSGFLTSDHNSAGYGTKYDDYDWRESFYFAVDGALYCLVDGSVYRMKENQILGAAVGTVRYDFYHTAVVVGDLLVHAVDHQKQVRYLNVKTGEEGLLYEFPQEHQYAGVYLKYNTDGTLKITYEGDSYDAFADTAYTVTFKDWDGTVLQTGTYRYGQLIQQPRNPSRAGYHFSGWDKPVGGCSENTVYTATYTPYSRRDGWHKDHEKWIYTVNDRRKTGWLSYNGNWYYMSNETGYMYTDVLLFKYTNAQTGTGERLYYLDSNGVMQTGWLKVDGELLYFKASGEAANGWSLVGGRWYYFDEYYMKSGWFEENGLQYYLDENTGMAVGWKEISGKRYYFAPNGDRVEGWCQIGGRWYYFDRTGEMRTGLCYIGNAYYLLDEQSGMQTGWRLRDNEWYYFKPSGAMAEGWAKIDGKWYYFSSSIHMDGHMVTGFVYSGGDTYYMDDQSGAMVYGWRKIKISNLDPYWYFFDNEGRMVTGWYKTGGKWYYFDENGHMLTEFQTVGGKTYYLGPNGAMRTGWYKAPAYRWGDEGLETYYRWHYADANGVQITGWLQQGGKWYYLVPWLDGAMATGRYKIDGVWYDFTEDGILIS